MSTLPVGLRVLMGIALLAIPQTGVLAQNAVVYGSVYDSIANAPLSDAAVFLWDTPHRTVSDADGRFRMENVPAGEYSVLFFHSRLGEMAASPGPIPIRLAAGDSMQVGLGTPSMFTLTTSQCLMEAYRPEVGAVAGWVGDGGTGMGLPGARVTLSWPSEEGRLESIETTTDGGGWYRFCDAPSDRALLASVRFLDRESMRREVTVGDHLATQASFMVSDLRTTDIDGHLIDSETNLPVDNAEVWLRGTPKRVLSDDKGAFHFDDVQPGQYMLMTEHLAYGSKMDTLDVPPDQHINVEMRLDTRPIDIAPLTVTVDARRMTERAMGGIQISRAKIDEVRQVSRDVADLVRAQHIAGVTVRRRGDGTMCIGYSTGQVRMLDNVSGSCVPMMVFINGAKASNANLAIQLPPDAIDRMVVYRPVEAGNLFGYGAANGVLMIFTKGN